MIIIIKIEMIKDDYTNTETTSTTTTNFATTTTPIRRRHRKIWLSADFYILRNRDELLRSMWKMPMYLKNV